MIRCLAALLFTFSAIDSASSTDLVVGRTLVLEGACDSLWPPGLREALDLELRTTGWRLLEGEGRAFGILRLEIAPCSPDNPVLEVIWTADGLPPRRTEVDLFGVSAPTRARVAALRLAEWISLPKSRTDVPRDARPDAIAGELGGERADDLDSAVGPERSAAPGRNREDAARTDRTPDWRITSSLMSSLRLDASVRSLGFGAALTSGVRWRPIATTVGLSCSLSTGAPLGIQLTQVSADVQLRSEIVRPFDRVDVEVGGQLGLTYGWLTRSQLNAEVFLYGSPIQSRAALLARADVDFGNLGVVVEVAGGYRFNRYWVDIVWEPMVPSELWALQGHWFVALRTGVRWSIDL